MKRNNFLKDYLTDDQLSLLAKAIGKVESRTSGEIRISIKHKRGFLEKNAAPRKLALKEFHRLGMHKTKNQTGVLIFILLESRNFEIIADKGINAKIAQDNWHRLAEEMKMHFSKKNYSEGILHCIISVGEVLVREFPAGGDFTNELPDDVVINP